MCPECNGVWLDPGELAEIRDAFPKENIKKLTTEKYISEIVASGGWSEHFENVDEAHLSISRISRMMVWIRD
jgi:Zn-finger nucleic acid-binding protein